MSNQATKQNSTHAKSSRPAESWSPTTALGSDENAPSSPDKVVYAIYKGILSGRIVPGQKLIEADLAQSLNVSRGPIREAFKRLSAEGIVETTMHRGAYVRSLTRQESLDFLEIVDVLTDFMAAKAADTMREADDDFRARNSESIKTIEQYAGITDGSQIEGSWHFYGALMILSGNSQLASIVPAMRLQLFRAQSSTYLDQEGHRQRALEYAKVAQRVLAGDRAGAQLAMRVHMSNTAERLASLPDEAFA